MVAAGFSRTEIRAVVGNSHRLFDLVNGWAVLWGMKLIAVNSDRCGVRRRAGAKSAYRVEAPRPER